MFTVICSELCFSPPTFCSVDHSISEYKKQPNNFEVGA